MTRRELSDALEATGYPVFRNETGGRVRLPYLVYQMLKDTPLTADHEVLADWHKVRVELYTALPDGAAERRVRGALEACGIYCDIERVPIPEDRLHMSIFEFETIEVRDA